VRGIVLDVEGTTTPIAFVHETLFPFAESRLADACARASADARIAEAVERLRQEHQAEPAAASPPGFGDGAAYAGWLMRQDRKSTGLKALQGILWEAGYRSGELRAPLYDDVAPALRSWTRNGVRLRVFSSGSVLAQKLLFAHTEHGDLTDLFEDYHDTTTGPKREPGAYAAIARGFALPPGAILFLSDVVAELDAAREAGLATGLVVRPGNPPADPGPHPVYRDFLPLFE
jgi:enolase-phosphatase E1